MIIDNADMERANYRLDELIEQGQGNSLAARNLRMFFVMQIPGWADGMHEKTTEQFVDPLKEIETFHDSEIRIIRWKMGTHFYAKYKNEDVVIDGEQKWGTHEEAYNKALEYIDGKVI